MIEGELSVDIINYILPLVYLDRNPTIEVSEPSYTYKPPIKWIVKRQTNVHTF